MCEEKKNLKYNLEI